MRTVTATDLARNTREILDSIALSGEAVGVERNQTMIALIGPPAQSMTAAQALADLTFPELTAEQATAWLKDSKDGFDDSVRDPWA